MQMHRFFIPGLAIESYLIFDEETRQGAVIDPTRQIEIYLNCALQENITITDILETHVHADFVSGAKELKKALRDKPKIHCSAMGGKEWIPQYVDHLVHDRDEIILGTTRLQAWHTPGHTPEHLIWIAYDDSRNPRVPTLAFTGDLLFVGSVGRPDLLGNENEKVLAKQLYRTLFETLAPLPDFIEIFPAHGAGSLCGKEIGSRHSSTLGYEKQCNPWLIQQPYETWAKRLLKEMPAAPAYFKEMKRINIIGLDKVSQKKEMPPLATIDEAIKMMSTCLTIDVRNPEAFSSGHLKNAINIPIGSSFALWAGSILPQDNDLFVVLRDTQEAMFILQSLRLIGIDSIKGFCNALDWKQNDWAKILHPSPLLNVIDVEAKKENLYILDVRTPGEWNSGHILGAHHIELAQVPSSLKQLPHDIPIAVVCGSGNRSSLIASLLNREGFPQAINVRGGMQAWIKAGLPISK